MSVLDLAKAKEHLNIPAADTQLDVELQDTIDAAEAAIAKRTGPLSPTTVTERVRTTSADVLGVSTTPVLSVTTVTPLGGTAIVGSTFDVDDDGLISYADGGWFTGAATYDVAYVAGRTSIPADLLYAVKVMVKHLWRSQRGASTRRGSGAGADEPALAYALPNAVVELIEDYVQDGFA